MTRKQFFKKLGINQSREKRRFTDIVKKYKGALSYFRLYLLLYTAIRLGRRGCDAFAYVEAIMDLKTKERSK